MDILVMCPFNSEHRILPSRLDIHCEKCILKKSGYDSTHSLYPSYNFSTSSAQTIKIDEITQMQILKSAHEESNFTLNIKHEPREVSQSIERYVCDFTPDERRVLYDSAVKNTKLPTHVDVGNDLTGVNFFNKSDEKPKTELELLQEQRDSKRRRAAYRGKRVHTDRKSYVEVLREVVDGLTSSLSHQEDTNISVKTSNSIAETVSNNRFVYKYAGNRNYSGNPYTRWLDIEAEESKLFKYCEKKSDSSYPEANSSRIQYSEDKTFTSKSRKSRSTSRERRTSSSELKWKRSKRSRSRSKCRGTKYVKSKRSRTPIKFKENKPKKFKTRSKSKETMSRNPRSRSRSVASKHKRSKKHKTRSKSKETMPKKSRSRSKSTENKYKRSKRHRTRSKSKELCSRKKTKHSKSPFKYYKLAQTNEKDSTIKLNSSEDHNKKKKHKHKRKHSKSPKRSHKVKKNNSIEVCKYFDDKLSKDNDIQSISFK